MKNFKTANITSIKMKNGAIFQVVLLREGLIWILAKSIPGDFSEDGYILINKNFISSINKDEHDEFKEKIFELKNINLSDSGDLNINLDNTNFLFNQLKEFEKLISLELKNNDINYVGKISLVREKSLRIHLISTKCKWLDVETFLYNEIRAIYIKNDYLMSLDLFIDALSK